MIDGKFGEIGELYFEIGIVTGLEIAEGRG